MLKHRWMGAVVLVLLLATPVVAWAAPSGQTEIPTFDEALIAASGPMVSIIVGFLISLAIEYWPEYQAWPGNVKRALFFALCLVVPVGSAALRGALGYAPWSFDPLFWQALWNGFGAGLAGTAVHIKARNAATR